MHINNIYKFYGEAESFIKKTAKEDNFNESSIKYIFEYYSKHYEEDYKYHNVKEIIELAIKNIKKTANALYGEDSLKSIKKEISRFSGLETS